jgi:hypothetical protein
MPGPRKIIVKPFGYMNGKTCEFEQAKGFNYDDGVVLLDGIRIHSYDELVRLASSDKYKDSEFIEIVLLPAISGG